MRSRFSHVSSFFPCGPFVEKVFRRKYLSDLISHRRQQHRQPANILKMCLYVIFSLDAHTALLFVFSHQFFPSFSLHSDFVCQHSRASIAIVQQPRWRTIHVLHSHRAERRKCGDLWMAFGNNATETQRYSPGMIYHYLSIGFGFGSAKWEVMCSHLIKRNNIEFSFHTSLCIWVIGRFIFYGQSRWFTLNSAREFPCNSRLVKSFLACELVFTEVRENWPINLVEHSSRMNCRRIMTASKEWELFEEQNQLKRNEKKVMNEFNTRLQQSSVCSVLVAPAAAVGTSIRHKSSRHFPLSRDDARALVNKPHWSCAEREIVFTPFRN